MVEGLYRATGSAKTGKMICVGFRPVKRRDMGDLPERRREEAMAKTVVGGRSMKLVGIATIIQY